MAETIYGQLCQPFTLRNLDESHELDEPSADGHAKKKAGGSAPQPAREADGRRDMQHLPEDRAAMEHFVGRLVADPLNREAFHRVLRGDPGLVGRALSNEELTALLVHRLQARRLSLVAHHELKEIKGGGSGGVVKLEAPAPVKEKEKEKEIICKLEEAEVECSHEVGGHARKPKNGVLEVVPAESGDKISLKGDWDGGCGKHPVWTVTGFLTSTEKKAKTSFRAMPWFVGSPTATMMLRWLSGVAPKTYSVQASSCEGSKQYTIKSYPSDKLTVTVEGEKWEALQSKLDWFIDHVLGKFLKNPHFEILKGSAEATAQWVEWKDHTAYYKWEASVGFNPLIGAKIRIPFGPTAAIPQWMKDMIHCEAGFFVEFAGGINVNGKWARETPAKAKMSAEAEGYVYGKVGAELKLVSKKLLSVEVAGQSGFGMSAAPDFTVEKPTLLIELKWEGLKGLVTASAAWGWIEIEHEFNLIDEQTIWEKHPFELVHEAA